MDNINRMKDLKPFRCLLGPSEAELGCYCVKISPDIISKISIVHVFDRKTTGIRFLFDELGYAWMSADSLVYLSLQSHIPAAILFFSWKERVWRWCLQHFTRWKPLENCCASSSQEVAFRDIYNFAWPWLWELAVWSGLNMSVDNRRGIFRRLNWLSGLIYPRCL